MNLTWQVKRIGILDPMRRIAGGLHRPLLRRGFLSDAIENAESAVDYCTALTPAAVILDLSMEGDRAPDHVRKIRERGFAGPLIAIDEASPDRLLLANLQRGADDAFSSATPGAEILERLDFILDCYSDAGPSPAPALDRLRAALTPSELRILDILSRAAPEVMSREAIMWDLNRRQMSPDDRSVDVYVSNIRRKIRLCEADIRIETVRGKGFRLADNSGLDTTRLTA